MASKKTYAQLPDKASRNHNFFELESHDVLINLPERKEAVKIHYKTAGNGRPMLLIHGLMTTSYSFRYVVPMLSEKYKLYIPDMPGAGRSGSPTDLSMSAPSMAEVINSFITQLELKDTYVVGNSLGGYMSLWFALKYPENLRKLIIIHSPGIPEARLYALNAALNLPGSRNIFQCLTKKPEEYVIKNVHYYNPEIMCKEEADEYSSIFKDYDRSVVFMKILEEAMDPKYMRLLQKKLKMANYSVPTRLLWSREDVLVSPDFGPVYQKMLNLPDSELIWFDNSSHFLQVDSPEETSEAILAYDN